MSHSSALSIGYTPKTFQHWFCAKEQTTTPHVAGRVLSQDAVGIHLQARCRRCGFAHEQILDEFPEGHRLYQVRITGEDGPHLPNSMRPVPHLEETFCVVATSAQDAHERAEFSHTLRFAGQLVCYYIDGELHLDDRF